MKCKDVLLDEGRSYACELTFRSKRIEKQITEANQQAEKMKMEVMYTFHVLCQGSC